MTIEPQTPDEQDRHKRLYAEGIADSSQGHPRRYSQSLLNLRAYERYLEGYDDGLHANDFRIFQNQRDDSCAF